MLSSWSIVDKQDVTYRFMPLNKWIPPVFLERVESTATLTMCMNQCVVYYFMRPFFFIQKELVKYFGDKLY